MSFYSLNYRHCRSTCTLPDYTNGLEYTGSMYFILPSIAEILGWPNFRMSDSLNPPLKRLAFPSKYFNKRLHKWYLTTQWSYKCDGYQTQYSDADYLMPCRWEMVFRHSSVQQLWHRCQLRVGIFLMSLLSDCHKSVIFRRRHCWIKLLWARTLINFPTYLN